MTGQRGADFAQRKPVWFNPVSGEHFMRAAGL
jgi:hypothetical protein